MEQGDRTKKVGVIDSEYIFHKGIQTLGGGGPPGKRLVSFLLAFSLFELLTCSIIFQLLFSCAKYVLHFTLRRVQILKS